MATSPGPSHGPRPRAEAEHSGARDPRVDERPATAEQGQQAPESSAAAAAEASDSGLSRRRFLTRASIGVAATAALVAGVPGASRLVAAERSEAEPGDVEPPGEDIVAHVRSTSTGELAVLVGTREVVYRDPALVRRLLAGARRTDGRA